MKKTLRFKLLKRFTSMICSFTELMNRRGGYNCILILIFLLLILNPFFSKAQFPYNETFRNSTTAKSDVVFGGAKPAFLTATSIDTEGNGYLRLTDNTGNQKAFVYSNNVFLGTYGLNIEFEYFTYGGTGADGICFFLFDAGVNSSSFNIGGFGGSLGYAQLYQNKVAYPGVSSGYLGIGLDEFGNYSNNNENRQGGDPAGQVSDNITLRGAGNGSAAVSTNYPWLKTTQTSALTGADQFSIAGNLRGAVDGAPEYRKVFINLVPRPGGGLFINVSVKHGNTITPVVTNYPYTTPIPARGLKYGISSSTGGSTNYHEIRGLSLTVDPKFLATPVAPSPQTSICQGVSGSLDILAGASTPNAGGAPNPYNVDLDLSTPGIQQSVTTAAGTFQFDPVVTKMLTFTPAAGFSGSSASINFNFMDIYGALSTTGTATFNIFTPIITTQPVGATVCKGSTFTTSVVASGTGILYQWQYLNAIGVWTNLTDGGGISGSATNTLVISNVQLAANNNQYRVVVSTLSGTCSVASNPVVLAVNPTMTATISPISQSVCLGSAAIPITFKGLNGTSPYTFTYTVSDGITTSPVQTQTTLASSDNVTFNQPTNVSGVFTYNMISVSSATGCTDKSFATSAITVLPNATIGVATGSGPVTQNVCAGTAIQPIVYQAKDAGGIDDVVFDKVLPGVTGVYDGSTKQMTISGTPTALALPGDYSYTVTTLGGCSSATSVGKITVLPNTTINLASAVKTDQQVICLNQPIVNIVYQVTNGQGAAAMGLPAELSQTYNATTGLFTISGTPKTAGLLNYQVTATGTCVSPTANGTITIILLPA